MQAYTWDGVGCEIGTWEIPSALLGLSDDPRLLARLIDAYIGHQVDADCPTQTIDGTVTTKMRRSRRVTSYTGTFGDRGHQCGLYFGTADGQNDAAALVVCKAALDEYIDEQDGAEIE